MVVGAGRPRRIRLVEEARAGAPAPRSRWSSRTPIRPSEVPGWASREFRAAAFAPQAHREENTPGAQEDPCLEQTQLGVGAPQREEGRNDQSGGDGRAAHRDEELPRQGRSRTTQEPVSKHVPARVTGWAGLSRRSRTGHRIGTFGSERFRTWGRSSSRFSEENSSRVRGPDGYTLLGSRRRADPTARWSLRSRPRFLGRSAPRAPHGRS